MNDKEKLAREFFMVLQLAKHALLNSKGTLKVKDYQRKAIEHCENYLENEELL